MYFLNKPAFLDSLSEKACLKNKGLAVITAGIANPPAPAALFRGADPPTATYTYNHMHT